MSSAIKRASYQQSVPVKMMLLCLALAVCLGSLSPVNPHPSSGRASDNAQCTSYMLALVNIFFKRTEIFRGDSTQIQYCDPPGGRPAHINDSEIDLSVVIDFYKSLGSVSSYTNTNPDNPVINYGVLSVNGQHKLPVFVIADIRRRHLRAPNTYPAFGHDVTEQMDLMGELNTDDRGYLLAHSLGGTSEALNIIPMARNVNRHLSLVRDSVDLNIPRSYWRSNEDWIRRFLLHDYPNGRVVWRLAVHYEDDVILVPQGMQNYRPVGFALQFTAYTNEDDNSSVYYISPQTTYLNDNDFSCSYEESYTYIRPRRDVSLQMECGTRFPNKPLGTVGSILQQGRWNTRHKVSFTYTIQEKTYFYGQSILDGHHWFIQELLPNGRMGRETSCGSWQENYAVVFPFFINGRQYFYGHSSEEMNWFIQELLPGGRMGEETDHGSWNTRHRVSFPYTISGRHFFYGQSILDGTHWFIQELLPGGKMGREISHGSWNENYQVVFPFSIGGRQFFYGHSTDYRNWFIQELLPGGKMGEETDHGQWATRHQVSVPYSIDGKQFYFGQSIIDGNHWYIQELLPNGKMGVEVSHGSWSDGYSVMFPYLINDRHFLYGHSTNTRNWFIRELF